MNICLLGLSGSGKTCYLYSASYVLARGVNIDGCRISVNCTNRRQQLRLNDGIESMMKGEWPKGTGRTSTFPYELMIDGKALSQFTIYDFRGGALDGRSDNDQDEADELFETFTNTSCVVVLVDGDTILTALDPACVSHEHRRNASFAQQGAALNKLNYIESLLRECYQRLDSKVPVLLVITKRDLFYESELKAGKELLIDNLPSLFSRRNDRIAGITAVSLGEDLQNYNGSLEGTLCLNTDGNVHLPILFALLQELNPDTCGIDGAEARNLIKGLFKKDVITFYRGGEPALILW